MTSANMDAVNQSVKAFNSLDTDAKLAALASIYSKVGQSIPADALKGAVTEDVEQLLNQVKDLRQEDQVQLLRDIVSNKVTDQETVALDPHPSEAMLELIPGAVTSPTTKFQSLSAESRLAFLYHLAQELGSSITSTSSDSSLSLDSLDNDQQISFLTQVV